MTLELFLRFAAGAWAIQMLLSGFSAEIERTETGYKVSTDFSMSNLVVAAILGIFTAFGYAVFNLR